MIQKPNKSDINIIILSLYWVFLTILFYTLLRIEFLVVNWRLWFYHFNLGSLLQAFIEGLRFDFSSVIWLSSLVLIGTLIPWPFIPTPLKERSLKTTYLLIHTPMIIFNMLDIELIHFVGRRMTPDSFYLMKEVSGKWVGLFSTYGFLIIFNFFLLWIFIKCIQSKNLSIILLNSKTHKLFESLPSR